MQKNVKWLGLIGVPLALISTVASVAFAAPKVPAADVSAPATVSAPAATATGTDIETNDDGTNAQADTDVETNDDASGAQEAPGTETAD